MKPNKLSNIKNAKELLDLFGYKKPPFDSLKMIKDLGIDLDMSLDLDRGDISGQIVFEDGKTKVWINPLDYSRRRNFTAAHEIGHYIFEIVPEIVKGNLSKFEAPRDTSEIMYGNAPNEIKANQFAAELIMPEEHIKTEIEECRKLNPDIDNKSLASKLSDVFQVSETAMIIRLKNLKIL
jgi:Zn-dependent peptidase ImmA (M78 family)